MKKKTIVWIFVIIIPISIVSAISVITIPKIKEHYDRVKIIKSLPYEAIESEGRKYYPTKMPLMWVPASLPPYGSQTVYRIINGETDYSHEFFAEIFVDDYDRNYLYIDGILFKTTQPPVNSEELGETTIELEEATTEPLRPVEVDEWMEIYAEYLNKEGNYGFYAGDINGDGFPELITMNNDANDIVETNAGNVYYFIDGEPKVLELWVVSTWGKVGYLEETNQIILLQWYGHTAGTFGSVDFFLYDWTPNGYVETRSVIRESGYEEYDEDKEDYVNVSYGQGYINGAEVDFDEFELALAEMYALLEKSTWFPLTDVNEVDDFLDYLIKWEPHNNSFYERETEAHYFTINDTYMTIGNARFNFWITIPSDWKAFDRSDNGDGYFIECENKNIDIRVSGINAVLPEDFYINSDDESTVSEFVFDNGIRGWQIAKINSYIKFSYHTDGTYITFYINYENDLEWFEENKEEIFLAAKTLRNGTRN